MTTGEYWSQNYTIVVTNNINLDNSTIEKGGCFCGKFDGGGFTITNFIIYKHQKLLNLSDSTKLALIDTIAEGAEVKNITFSNYKFRHPTDGFLAILR